MSEATFFATMFILVGLFSSTFGVLWLLEEFKILSQSKAIYGMLFVGAFYAVSIFITGGLAILSVVNKTYR